MGGCSGLAAITRLIAFTALKTVDRLEREEARVCSWAHQSTQKADVQNPEAVHGQTLTQLQPKGNQDQLTSAVQNEGQALTPNNFVGFRTRVRKDSNSLAQWSTSAPVKSYPGGIVCLTYPVLFSNTMVIVITTTRLMILPRFSNDPDTPRINPRLSSMTGTFLLASAAKPGPA